MHCVRQDRASIGPDVHDRCIRDPEAAQLVAEDHSDQDPVDFSRAKDTSKVCSHDMRMHLFPLGKEENHLKVQSKRNKGEIMAAR